MPIKLIPAQHYHLKTIKYVWEKSQQEMHGDDFLDLTDEQFIENHHNQYDEVLSGTRDGNIYLGYENEEPVALVWLSPKDGNDKARSLTELFIIGQKLGRGTEVIQKAEELCGDCIEQMFVSSVKQSVGFYKKLGYQQLPEEGENNTIPLVKKLGPPVK